MRVAYDEEPAATSIEARACPCLPGESRRTRAAAPRRPTAAATLCARLRRRPSKVDRTYVDRPREPQSDRAARDDRGVGRRATDPPRQDAVAGQRPELRRADLRHRRRSDVRVISPFVGGAFGSALRTWPHVILAAMAARQVGRPVKIVLTRRQMYYVGRPPAAHDPAGGARRRAATAGWSRPSTRRPPRPRATRSTPSRCSMRRAALRLRQPLDALSAGPAQHPHADADARARPCRAACTRWSARWTSSRSSSASTRSSCGCATTPTRDPAERSAVVEQVAERVPARRRRALRLGAAQPRAALDAERRPAGRLRHGGGDLSGAARAGDPRARASCPTAARSCGAPPATWAPAPTPR